jgi:hypothetical protein
MLNSVLAIFSMLITAPTAMSYGRVFPTHFPMNTPPGTQRLVVKNVSELPEFNKLILKVDDTRRMLELREGIEEAKVRYIPRFTFRCICGSTYADVFGFK